MFDLDKALAAWLRRYEHERAILPEDLREVEQHVRDHVAELVEEGASPQEAFVAATRDFGAEDEVRAAYQSVLWGKLKRKRSVGDHLSIQTDMLKNFLVTAFRNVRRQKGYAFINVVGLAVGLACSFFILLWVMNELRFDRFHADGDRLYRVLRHGYVSENIYTWQSVPKPLADVLEQDYPEVENAILVDFLGSQLITLGENTYRKEGFVAGPAFFEAFTFPLLLGDPATVLDDPQSMVISEELAASLFGPDWRQDGTVLGQTLRVDHETDFRIAGVFEEIPAHSTLRFDYVLPLAEWLPRNGWAESWGNAGLQLFVRMRAGTDYEAFNRKIRDVIRENEGFGNATPFLQPFEDMRLYSDYRQGQLVGGRITYVRIFAVVAVFLLLIACINFMNLATARSAQRAKEIGVRKVVGATQRSLVRQFIVESMLTAVAAFVLAALLVVALLPVFGELTGENVALDDLDGRFIGLMFGITLATGLLAGSYPAFYLSSFSPIGALKGIFRQRSSAGTLRKGLVVFQFALSALLIMGTFAVYEQVQYIRTMNLGLDHSHLIYMRLEGAVGSQYDAFQQELTAMPGIERVTASDQNPLNVGSNTTDPVWEGKDPDHNPLFYIINANYDFVETMKIDMAAGRSFSRAFGGDSANYVINERAAKAMGLEDPIGASLSMWGTDGQIVGVVEDFVMNSLYEAIEPTIIRLDPENTDLLYVRAAPGKTREALASLEAVHERFNPGYPFEYEFLDKTYEETYRSEMVMGRLANAFAFIAILISCLGLLGLSAFTAEQRTKEIGVRKVLGASEAGLVVLLSKDFARLVLLGFVLAVPAAYYVIDRWLGSFEYHTEVGAGIFLVTGVATMVIALVTVSYQAIRAAMADPVKSLRFE